MCSKYECIRCGYSTDLKHSMNLHLYKKKKPCQTILNNIELTDEIKKYILENQVYKIPEVKPDVKADVKPEEVKPVKEVEPDIKPEVKEVKPKVKKVKPMKEVKPVKEVTPEVKTEVTPEEVKPEVKPEVTHEVKPEVTPEVKREIKTEVKTEVFRTIEINYDELYMKLMFLLKLSLKSFKNAVFDPYEMYLIYFMENENFDQKLRDYYKFIATFGFSPIVKNKSDNFIQYYRFYRDKEHLDLPEKTFNLSEKYMNLYTAEKSKIIHTEKELLTKKVMEIIFIKKDIENYEEIGKLFNMDEEFIRINA